MSNVKVNIQEQVLFALRKSRRNAKFYLVSGHHLYGRVAAYDMYCILVEGRNRQQLLFKHAISNIELPDDLPLRRPHHGQPHAEASAPHASPDTQQAHPRAGEAETSDETQASAPESGDHEGGVPGGGA